MKTRTIALLTGALSIAALGGVAVFVTTGDKDRFAECRKGAIAGGAAEIGGPLELVSETGKTVTDKEIFTRPSLLYFGYTYCPISSFTGRSCARRRTVSCARSAIWWKWPTAC